MNDIVAPEIENAAPSRFLKFEPGQFAVAPVQDRVGEKEQRADGLKGGALGAPIYFCLVIFLAARERFVETRGSSGA